MSRNGTNAAALPHVGSSREASQGSTAGKIAGDDGSPPSPSSPSSPGKGGVQHRKRDFYSESSPIPSIQRFFKRGLYDVVTSRQGEDSEHDETEESDLDDVNEEEGEPSEVDGGEEKSRKPQRKHSQQRRSKQNRTVDDPITRRRVRVRDVGRREYDTAIRDTEAMQDEKGENEQHGAHSASNSQKQHGRKTHKASQNVLAMPFPPEEPLPRNILQLHRSVAPLLLLSVALALLPQVPSLVSVAFNAWLVWWLFNSIHRRTEDLRWERERQRGMQATSGHVVESKQEGRGSQHDGEAMSYVADGTVDGAGIKESAEWLNALMDKLWSVMNPDLFSSLGQTLEDVMQASVPRFIHGVKVEDLAQGSTPLRLTGFRVLPDAESADLQKAGNDHLRQQRKKEKSNLGSSLRKRRKEAGELGHDASHVAESDNDEDAEHGSGDAAGAYINLELSFVYRAKPASNTVASKSRNAHLLIKFWVGLRKLATAPLPVLVEIRGMVGTIRARVQLTPDPPFFKNVTFCFMGLPRIAVDVIPLHVNTTNIPILAGFVQSSMDAAMGEYCAPSSLTMDVGEILMGDNIKREVHALGIVLVYIHSATDLEKQDVRGSSDPYCTIQLSKSGKILYATRVALNDLCPRWEERHVIVVNPEAVNAREKISIGLWDSDRFSADDMLGRAEVDLEALVRRPGRMFRRKDTLIGLAQDMKKQGYIEWSLGYFAKTPNRRRLNDEHAREREQREVEKVQAQDPDTVDRKEEDVGTDAPNDDASARDTDREKQSVDYDNKYASKQTRNIEHGVAFEPPNPALPSGILSMQVHSISQLECISTRSSMSDINKRAQNGAPGQDVDQVENQEDQATSPSAFFRIILNDETVFQSRTKTLSNNPFFNAGTERFIRDWRRTLVTFVIYDSRLREADAILGVIPIKLTDIFTETSQVTTVFPIAGGVGRGQVRMSLLFRPVQGLSRRQEKLGWDIGTVQILGPPHASLQVDKSEHAAEAEHVFKSLSSATIRARTLVGRAKIPSRKAKFTDQHRTSSIEWHLGKKDLPFKVPARRRYAAPFILEFHGSGGGVHIKRKALAMSVIWLQDVPDDTIAEYRLPIWRAKEGHDFHRLCQNYHNYEREDEAEGLGVERVGYLTVKLRFKSGVGHTHTHFDTNPDAKIVMDAWRACASVGLRSIGGDFTDMRWNTQGAPMDQRHDTSQDLGKTQKDNKGQAEEDVEETSAASGDSDDTGDNDDSDDGLDAVAARHDKSSNEHREPHDEHSNSDRSSAQDLEDDQDDPPLSPIGKVRKWTEERRELHRQHRGIKQYKAARTASWLGHGVKESGSRVLSSLTIQDRRVKQVETEL